MKMMLTTLFAGLLLVGCGYSDNVSKTDDGLYCYEGYSYIRIDGTVVPSPETLEGYTDLDCPQP
jgi:hypothetical protein